MLGNIKIKKMIAGVLLNRIFVKFIGIIFSNNVKHNGVLINVDNDAISDKTKARLFYGFYESAELRFIDKYISGDLDVVELGSSIGVTAKQILKKLNRENRLVCVEANPYLMRTLESNISNEMSHHNITIKNRVISYEHSVGYAQEFYLSTSSLSGSVHESVDVDNDVSSGVLVSSTTLSSILEEDSIEQYILVADIEGAELEIVENDKKAFESCRMIIIELHNITINEKSYTIDDIKQKIEQYLNFTCLDSYGSVYLFVK